MPTCGSRGISDGIYPVSRGDRRQNNEPGGGLFSGRVKLALAAAPRYCFSTLQPSPDGGQALS